MSDTPPKGLFVWYELRTSNPEKAKDFYTKVIGWDTELFPNSDPNMPYTMWKTNGKPIGGLTNIPPFMGNTPMGNTPLWMGYICVADVDATATQIQQLGGRLLREPMDIPTVGRFVPFADPQGAINAVFTPIPKDVPNPIEPPKDGEFSWNELVTTDHGAAFDFYTKLFGWEKISTSDLGPMGIYQIYGKFNIPLGGMFDGCKVTNKPPVWFYYINVDSADKAAERVTANGGTVLNGPMNVPGGGRITQCQDPQGAVFAVYSAS